MIIFSLLCILILASNNGCLSTKWRDFRPANHETLINLFGRYQLEIFGYASGAHNIFFELSFIKTLKDTTNLDTIPILTIDSFCIVGHCLDSQSCYQPQSWYETNNLYGYIFTHYQRFVDAHLVKGKDLWFDEGQVIPSGYGLSGFVRLPDSCTDSSLCLYLYARLNDRNSFKEIKSEVKKIPMYIENRKRTYIFSEFKLTIEDPYFPQKGA
jgi:hypothetical protein